MPELLSTSTATARKSHECDLCWTTIQPGETYTTDRLIGDDGLYVFKTCDPCKEITPTVIAWLEHPWEGYYREDFHAWAESHQDDDQHGTQARAFLQREHTAVTRLYELERTPTTSTEENA